MSESDKIERFRAVLETQLGNSEVTYVNPVDSILDQLEKKDEEYKSKKTVKLMTEINKIQERNEQHIVDLEEKIANFLR